MDILSMALALSGGASSWNDLTDKPFCEDGMKPESFATTLTFDGNKTGKETTPIYGMGTDEAYWVKVSDGYINSQNAIGKTMYMYDMAGISGYTGDNLPVLLAEDHIVEMYEGRAHSIFEFVMVVNEEIVLNESHFTPGVWFGLIENNGVPVAYVKSISGSFTATRQVTNIVKIPDKYINAEWMATPAKEIMPETSIPLTEATGSNFISGTKLNISLIPGKTYAFIFDGVEYVTEDTATAEMQAQGAAGAWILIASEDYPGAADLSVSIINENWPYSDTPGVYVSCTSEYYGDHTLTIYEDGAPKKLPAKYLPDVSDLPESWISDLKTVLGI